MQHPFIALSDEYTALLSRMAITRESAVDAAARRLLGFIDAGRYKEGCDATGVPQIDAAASFEREAGSNFRLSPAQGDPWDRVSVHVPRGIGPFASFAAAQIKSYQIDHLDAVGAGNWSWERSCYEWELFNGFGYRANGVHSPYLWAGTNIYTSGKYVADGRFDRAAIDQQLGVIPMMYRMVELRPDLALPVPFPVAMPATPPGSPPPSARPAPAIPPPMPAPIGLHDAAALQQALNSLGCDPPLDVDDHYGRKTRRAVEAFQQVVGIPVDGLAGPQTWAAINERLKQ